MRLEDGDLPVATGIAVDEPSFDTIADCGHRAESRPQVHRYPCDLPPGLIKERWS
jgi:hypothetical protein